MKTYFTFALLLLLISCSASDNISSKVENFDWLVGTWVRTNDAEGKITYEKWLKYNDSIFVGEGITLNGKDTVFHENIRLSAMHGVWSFDVQMPGEPSATKFVVTKMDSVSFVAENPTNEFPKVIQYRIEDSVLSAEISAGDMKVPFRFRRVN